MGEEMVTERPQVKRGQIVFVGSKGSGKSSLYECLKSPTPQVIEVPPCSVLVEEWKPFDLEYSPVAEECRKFLEGDLTEEDFGAVFQVWDICGRESLWTCQQLCISKMALFVLVFNVRNPMDAKLVPQWVQMIQSKSCGANIIVVASNCEVFDDSCEHIVQEVQTMENAIVDRINEELTALRENTIVACFDKGMLALQSSDGETQDRDLKLDDWVRSRVEKLEKTVQGRPRVCPTVFLTSAVTGKGLSDLRCAILKHLFDVDKFPHIHRSMSVKEMDLLEKVRSTHDGKNMVMSWKEYREIASSVGLNDEDEFEQASEALEMNCCLVRVNAAGSFRKPETTIVITDPCCFANACAMIHRDEEMPQDFVNKLQKSHHVQRFWPTSTRPNDWTLRSAIEDVVDRGMIRESFLPLCWQVWDMNEEDIKKLLPVMIKLGILVDDAPKAGYEIELALSYFKNLSVTKRYHLPLLLKLPKTDSQAVWPEKAPESTVTVGWQYQFQQGLSKGLLLSILAACINYTPHKTVLAHWQTGVIVRTGDVDVRLVVNARDFYLSARCKIVNGNRRALNMAWTTLAHYLYVTESFLSNFPGLYYQFASPYNVDDSPKTIYHLIQDYVTNAENSCEALWVLPPFDLNGATRDEMSVPSDVLTWFHRLSGQSSIYLAHECSSTDEVKQLALNLEQFGFDVTVREALEEPSHEILHAAIQRCSLVILFLTKSYLEDPALHEVITRAQNNNKYIIAARFEADVASAELTNVVNVDLDKGSGSGISHVFDAEQVNSLVAECQTLVYGSGDVNPLSPPELENQSSSESSATVIMEPCKHSNNQSENDLSNYFDEKRVKKVEGNKRHVQFFPGTGNNFAVLDDSQIQPLAACTVAAAMVGAAAQHLSQTGQVSEASTRAATATANVARAVANGDADAATDAMKDVVTIVDGLVSLSKQMENGFDPRPKSKTCVIV